MQESIYRPTSHLNFLQAMERLLLTIQRLSLAKDMQTIIDIVRVEARALTYSDGATFVLRDGNLCYYVDEDAISPLWKGKKFPMETCVSGWVMIHKQPAIIKDIYKDPRIPIDAYKPTFVKSLVMIPIREEDPIGAIGNYWSYNYLPSAYEIKLLQTLADSTAIAIGNIQHYAECEGKIASQAALIEELTKEIEMLKSRNI